MELLLLTLGLLIAGYIAFVLMFPKAVPEERSAHTKHVLHELMGNTRATEAEFVHQGKASDILRDEYSEESELIKGFYSLPLLKTIYVALVQAGYQKKSGLIALLLIVGLFALIGLFLAGGFGPASLLLAPAFTYMAPKIYFERKVRKRNEAFINQFPDVLDMIVRGVRSGFPVSSALNMVAENMDPPVSTEFQRVVNEISLGRSITESLQGMAARIREPDINFFVVVLSVQQETGGNLAEVVSNLSQIIRKRKQLRMKIKAMTSEGRATAVILGSLPFLIFFVLFFLRRDYLEPLWQVTTGQIVLGSAFGLVVLCMWIVNKMIDIDI